ncbi:flagellar biosynthesis protein FliQ [Echinimonas agarilytica]|uniref:Flagellar biosynthetic protein FliQ n=1 Tax=Echinimonas agarilytica TaxID=1215918 RepID=A0AA41W527_9GAMM|nr:flagellar biosynthesis protein FliQ [Echinimonas agarilytica]MCM2678978.1 flagellar biosynthesis protein FliQ [Echinimonas agarilytica]
MTPEVFVDIFRDALQIIVIMVSAIVLPSLAIGLVVAVFQAATSINEQTLSFLPRLLVTLGALMALGHWLTATITEFTLELVARIPAVIS